MFLRLRPMRGGLVAAAALTLLASLVFSVAPAQAATYTVTNLNDSGPGSLRQAILDANASAGADTTNFAVTGTIDIAAGGTLSITDDLTINGPGAADLIIDIRTFGGVLFVDSGVTANVGGVTVTNGSGVAFGGGIDNRGILTLVGTTVSGNNSGNGGGINNEGTLTLIESAVTGNLGSIGGGIRNPGTLTVTDSTIAGNMATYGGGIDNFGTLTVTGSTFSNNSARNQGGAIAQFGVGARVINSTFHGNSAGDAGGGIATFGNHTIESSTFSGNSASQGGGIWSSFGAPVLTNTIVADSPSGGNCSGAMGNGGGNIDSGSTCAWGSASGSMSDTDPLLDTSGLQENGGPTETIALQPTSPAIDAAVSCPPPAHDQRGITRPQGDACDIGAFELEVRTIPVFIDITPGSTPNVINLSKKGVIAVAVLGSNSFNPANVDPTTACFGDAEDDSQRDCTVAPGTVLQDVNKDKIKDLVLHFETQQTGIDPGDTQACLTGELFDGTSIEGCDSIKTK